MFSFEFVGTLRDHRTFKRARILVKHAKNITGYICMNCELPHFKQFPTRKCCGRSAPTQALPEATQAFIFLSWQAHSSTKIALYSLFILTSIMSALLVFTTQIEAKLALVWSSMDWYREPSIGMKLKCGTQAGSGVKQCTL